MMSHQDCIIYYSLFEMFYVDGVLPLRAVSTKTIYIMQVIAGQYQLMCFGSILKCK